ncbi:MAG: replication factor C small subunit [Candidatus Woesearchaeota archaeon]
MIWLEKYRPKEFDDVFGQDLVVDKIKAFVKRDEIPHLLFSGPAGTGKTTLAKVIAYKLYGDDWKNNVLELNASDERGIDVVRDKIKQFARTVPNKGFKIVYLDESDALTSSAQQALRRIMEEYSSITRFILSCNYISKIIDPIQSRCAVFRFRRLKDEEVMKIIENVSENENLKLNKKAKKALVEISNGDARRVVNVLQSCSVISKEIDEKLIYSMIGIVEPKELKSIIETAIEGRFFRAKSQLEDLIYQYGLSGYDLVKQVGSVLGDIKIKDNQELIKDAYKYLGEIEYRLNEGCSTEIQINSFLALLSKNGR